MQTLHRFDQKRTHGPLVVLLTQPFVLLVTLSQYIVQLLIPGSNEEVLLDERPCNGSLFCLRVVFLSEVESCEF